MDAAEKNAVLSTIQVPPENAVVPTVGQHAVRRDRKWAVRNTGAAKVTKIYDTQQEAINAARGLAQKQNTELYIHDPDGRIRKRDSFGNDRFPPIG